MAKSKAEHDYNVGSIMCWTMATVFCGKKARNLKPEDFNPMVKKKSGGMSFTVSEFVQAMKAKK